MESCCASSSSNFSRCHAGNAPLLICAKLMLGGGLCSRRRLSASVGRLYWRSTLSGRISRRSKCCSAAAMALRSVGWVKPLVVG